MKTKLRFKSIILSIVCMGFTLSGFAQAGWEADFVRGINVRYPDNPGWKTLSSTAKPISVAIPFGMLAVSLLSDNKKLETGAYEAVAGLAIASVATEVLKVVVKRPRPYKTYDNIYPDQVDDSYAFPSGHTSVAFASATSLFLATKKWYIGVPALAWATGVGYSRIYLGQHYPSDVFVGAVVGAASAYASHWLNKKFFSGKKKTTEKK